MADPIAVAIVTEAPGSEGAVETLTGASSRATRCRRADFESTFERATCGALRAISGRSIMNRPLFYPRNELEASYRRIPRALVAPDFSRNERYSKGDCFVLKAKLV